MNSTFLTLNNNDFLKGLIMAVLSTVITVVYQTVEAGSLVFDWKAIGTMALTTALAYIMKNLFTNSTGKLFAKEQKWYLKGVQEKVSCNANKETG